MKLSIKKINNKFLTRQKNNEIILKMDSNQNEPSITGDIKILVIGRSGSGKTSFINKWSKNTFSEAYKATIVSEFSQKIIKINDKVYRVQLWDLAGQDRGIIVTKAFSKGSHGCLIMAEVDDKISLEETLKWKNSVDEVEKYEDGENLYSVLLENKADKLSEDKINDVEELEIFAKNNGFVKCFRTSAKTGYNVNESMDYLTQLIIKKFEDFASKDFNSKRNTVNINPDDHKNDDPRPKQSWCC